jgi:hypothetical protein
VDHPDRKLVTNQNLGHIFNPSSVLSRGTGRTEHYVLADLFAWLAAYSGLSQLYSAPTVASNLGTNTNLLSPNTAKKYLKDDSEKLFKLHIQTAEFHKDKIERRGGVEQ